MFALFQPSRRPVRGADCSPVARARTAVGQPDLAISLPFWAHCSRWLLFERRPTGLGSGFYKDNVDYGIYCGEGCIGGI